MTPVRAEQPPIPPMVERMALFLRAFEDLDGTWTCRQGNRVWDVHSSLDEATVHLRELAARMEGPVWLIVHRLGGTIEHLEEVQGCGTRL